MELYNPTTDIFNYAGLEKDLMVAADVEVAELDTTELKRRMTCKSVTRGWAKWVKAVKRHPKYLKATKTQRRKFWKKVFKWAIKFDRKNHCGWVKAWRAYCKKAHAKLAKFIRKAKRHPKYLRATKAQRRNFWRKVAKKVARWNHKKKCHMVSRKWKKIMKKVWKIRASKRFEAEDETEMRARDPFVGTFRKDSNGSHWTIKKVRANTYKLCYTKKHGCWTFWTANQWKKQFGYTCIGTNVKDGKRKWFGGNWGMFCVHKSNPKKYLELKKWDPKIHNFRTAWTWKKTK
jgi:hypothetical protein